MSLHDEKAAALAEVLTATGEEIVWKGRTLHALVSDNPLSQDLGLGGFDGKRDCTMKVLRPELAVDRPKLGEKVEFQGLTYRITRVTDQPRSGHRMGAGAPNPTRTRSICCAYAAALLPRRALEVRKHV